MMDGDDGDDLNFDFEGGIEAGIDGGGAGDGGEESYQLARRGAGGGLPEGGVGYGGGQGGGYGAGNAGGGAGAVGVGMGPGRKNYRQTVCRHWLRGLCMKGDACGFLHQFDPARMPICRFFAKHGECHEPDCVFKHSAEDIKDCHMYKLGFCPNGLGCRYRHNKLPGPPPPVEETLQRYQRPQQTPQQQEKESTTTRSASQAAAPALPAPPGKAAEQGQQQQLNAENGALMVHGEDEQPGPPPHLPPGSCRFFLIKSLNYENLEISVRHGVWATHRNNEGKLLEAFETCDHVILVFSVNESRHFQGYARMCSRFGETDVPESVWKFANGSGSYGRNFSVRWLKLCELPFQDTRHLRNAFNEDQQIKVGRDTQEMEPEAARELTALLFGQPDSPLMDIARQSEDQRKLNLRARAKLEGMSGRGGRMRNERPLLPHHWGPGPMMDPGFGPHGPVGPGPFMDWGPMGPEPGFMPGFGPGMGPMGPGMSPMGRPMRPFAPSAFMGGPQQGPFGMMGGGGGADIAEMEYHVRQAKEFAARLAKEKKRRKQHSPASSASSDQRSTGVSPRKVRRSSSRYDDDHG
eukprot:jgi/Chlat1/5102/Chrsp33S05101